MWVVVIAPASGGRATPPSATATGFRAPPSAGWVGQPAGSRPPTTGQRLPMAGPAAVPITGGGRDTDRIPEDPVNHRDHLRLPTIDEQETVAHLPHLDALAT